MAKKRASLDSLTLSDTAAEQPTDTQKQEKSTETTGTTRKHTSLYLPEPAKTKKPETSSGSITNLRPPFPLSRLKTFPETSRNAPKVAF